MVKVFGLNLDESRAGRRHVTLPQQSSTGSQPQGSLTPPLPLEILRVGARALRLGVHALRVGALALRVS